MLTMNIPRKQQQLQLQQQHHHHGSKLWNASTIFSIISHALVSFLSFHVGLLYNLSSVHQAERVVFDTSPVAAAPNTSACVECKCPVVTPVECNCPVVAPNKVEASQGSTDSIFPHANIGQFVAGAALVDRASFISSFDIGVPWDRPREPGNSHVLLLYTQNSSVPSVQAGESSSLPVFESAAAATKNCNVLKVVLTQQQEPNQCLAIMGQYESYHVHKFMRLPKDDNDAPVSANNSLRYVARAPQAHSRQPQFDTLNPNRLYGRYLTNYIRKMPETLERLRPIAAKAAGTDNTIVVMICNFGQSQMLFNFVCSARARRLDISKVLLFATDRETVELATELGLHVFDVQDAFGDMPKSAAAQFRDQTFSGMMLGKIYCVHLINLLGYDLLFQDADVIWYKNPIDDLFKDLLKTGDFDMYFQDDGARHPFLAPHSACSGFYFVRHNSRTEYLFSMFARMGDQVIAGGSHQVILTNLINDHSSSRGLKVKVFAVDDFGERLPSGYHYNRWKNYMLDFINGKKDPFIYHMHWTVNKEDKRMFYQQMSEWYVHDQCVGRNISTIDAWSSAAANPLTERCCLAEPNFQCHYRDKPSTKQCKDSPAYDVANNAASFW